jgi:ankyrin repeat protein
MAVNSNSLELVCLLLESGANVDAVGKSGRTPLHYAIDSYPDVGVARVLIERGCNVNFHQPHSDTPLNRLILSCVNRRVPPDAIPPALLLIQSGADVNLMDNSGAPPVLNALRHPAAYGVFRLLHQAGACLGVMDTKGNSVLHYIASYGDKQHVEYLRDLPPHQFEVQRVNREGLRPLDCLEARIKGLGPISGNCPEFEDASAIMSLLKAIEEKGATAKAGVTDIGDDAVH